MFCAFWNEVVSRSEGGVAGCFRTFLPRADVLDVFWLNVRSGGG